MTAAPWSRVLVTGGAGAIGSNLAQTLAGAGCRVTVFDDLSSGTNVLTDEGIRFVRGSICSDRDLELAFSPEPEVVFHLAALFANQNSVENPCTDIEVNGLGTIKVLEHARRLNVRKVLFSSSSCVYGPGAEMREESVVGSSDTPYAITKLLGEHYCSFWSRHHGLDTVIVRMFNSYGPGEFPGRYRNVVPNFFALALQGKPLPISGSGEEVRDFNYVDDAIRGIVLAMQAETAPAAVYNLASGVGTRIIDLASLINESTGNRAGVVFVPRRPWDTVSRRVGIIDKARRELRYAPSVALREGLRLTHAWFRQAWPRP